MFEKVLKIISAVVFCSAFLWPNFIFATDDLEQKCLQLAESGCAEAGSVDCRKNLEDCQTYYEKKSGEVEADITKTQGQKKTLQNTIYTLSQKIKNLDYQVYQSKLVINDLNIQVGDTQSSIIKTTLKIKDSTLKLAEILRDIYGEDQKSITEILFSEKKISGFFQNMAALEALDSKSKNILSDIKVLKTNLEGQKDSLDQEKTDLEQTVKIQTLQKQESDKTKKDQEYYLKLTETEYQKQLAQKTEIQKKASEIKARIFDLIGVSKAPTFGEAYEIAKYVEGAVGIRPAYLLAILTQESNLGKNVGQCYLKDDSTGSGAVAYSGKAISKVMKPTRDVSPFVSICTELGRDPHNTPVSCPMSFGYGGAMGPAQFIPSTWALFSDKIKSIIGKPGDPWNIKDAFLAAGLYLADAGATSQTYTSEWNASLRYFSGSLNMQYRFYADSVMKIAGQYDDDINALGN
jgi:membrane-bound lytic murein transglycosylase B